MFYVKTKLSSKAEMKTELSSEAYTICPECGKEIKIDLVEAIRELPEFDFFGTSIYCKECSEKLHTK